MCVLDVHYPVGIKDSQRLCGSWRWPNGRQAKCTEQLSEQGIAVVAVEYRLSPKVKVVDCIDDAAAAVAWTFANIKDYGGSPRRFSSAVILLVAT